MINPKLAEVTVYFVDVYGPTICSRWLFKTEEEQSRFKRIVLPWPVGFASGKITLAEVMAELATFENNNVHIMTDPRVIFSEHFLS